MRDKMKIFKCNEAEVTEWCMAKDKKQAYEFMNNFWDCGLIMKDFYVDPYLKSNIGKTLDDFIDYFFIEELPKNEITLVDRDDILITKTVKEWLKDVYVGPGYLFHAPW